MSVVGVVDGQGTSGASGLSGPDEKKKKVEKKADKKSTSSASKLVKSDKPVKSSSSRPPTSSLTADQGKSTAPSTDSRITDLDKKWLDRFNRVGSTPHG